MTITVDNELSLISTNPVQNKVVTAAVNAKQSTSNLVTTITNFLSEHEISLPLIDFNALEEQVLSFIRNYSAKFFSVGKAVVTKTGSFVISLMFIVFSLYFCFLDGPYLLSLIKKAIPKFISHTPVFHFFELTITKKSKYSHETILGYLFKIYRLHA